eukprot:CAMPEP_0119272232 /NCGR_PEP_ID=MMETSP1329-20130426/8491_1 /TAXON_ID=114041 /ORGANISM="Genus nov. species nov., Strain RCC1024" /LENGTH=37 /DNA_ID= /DNA_START= /DNA_END= /DNA_ORIENTATION=
MAAAAVLRASLRRPASFRRHALRGLATKTDYVLSETD